MGPETLIPLLLSGGGALLQSNAQQEQADQKRATLNQQLERDADASRKSTALVQGEGQNYGVDARRAALEDQQGKTFTQIQSDMQGAGGAGAVPTAGDAGAVSEDFLKEKAGRAVTEGTRLTDIAREAAKSRAPGQVQGSDGLRKAGLAGSLQNIFGTNTNMAHATVNDADAIQEPGYGALGSIASAIAPATMGASSGLMSKMKYGGTSIIPTAANYTNQMDMGAGIRF